MELICKKVKQNIEKVQETQQVTFDNDYVIKDNKPDVMKIICQSGTVKIEDTKANGDTIWLTGSVEFEVLYKSDESVEKIEAIKDSFQFQEKVLLDEIESGDNVRTYAKINDLSVGIINSRKISVRGLIDLEIYIETEEQIDIPNEVDSDDVQQLFDEEQMLELKGNIRDVLRVRCELQLPKTKPNIWKLLYNFTDIRNFEYSYQKDRITINGELHTCILYLSEEQELCFHEKIENFSNDINCDGIEENSIIWLRSMLMMQQIQVENDYDGEMRQVSMEAALSLDGKIWEQQTVTVLKDMYSISENIRPCYENVKKARLLMKNEAKCRVMEQLFREADADRILRTCGNKCSVQIEQIKNCENGIVVSGFLVVKSINIVENDECPIQMQVDSVGFEQFVEIPGIDAGTYREISAQPDQVQINYMDNCEYEIKATISINVLALVQEDMEIITGIEISEPCEPAKRPGLVGYIVQKGDRLWNIAKKYHTTVENIMKVNELDTEQINENDKLIITRIK